MMEQVLAPSMQHAQEADLGAQMGRVSSDGAESLGRGAEQDIVDEALVLEGEGRDLLRHREDNMESDTLYAATGGGMGPGTIAALEGLLVDVAMFPDALFCSATDANGPGDRFADRHQSLARKFGVPFVRLRPPTEGGDWNEVLRAQS